MLMIKYDFLRAPSGYPGPRPGRSPLMGGLDSGQLVGGHSNPSPFVLEIEVGAMQKNV